MASAGWWGRRAQELLEVVGPAVVPAGGLDHLDRERALACAPCPVSGWIPNCSQTALIGTRPGPGEFSASPRGAAGRRRRRGSRMGVGDGPVPVGGGVLVPHRPSPGVVCPRRAINSATVAPAAAARVAPVWRRSWNRRSGRPAASRAVWNASCRAEPEGASAPPPLACRTAGRRGPGCACSSEVGAAPRQSGAAGWPRRALPAAVLGAADHDGRPRPRR